MLCVCHVDVVICVRKRYKYIVNIIGICLCIDVVCMMRAEVNAYECIINIIGVYLHTDEMQYNLIYVVCMRRSVCVCMYICYGDG